VRGKKYVAAVFAMAGEMKKVIKFALAAAGFEVRRRSHSARPLPGSSGRPIGSINSFLEDVKARGFVPAGIIDVGANRGNWARMALSIYPESGIILIEPQDEMDQPLAELCRDEANCVHVKAGAGRAEGELVQTIWDDFDGSSFLPGPDEILAKTGRQRHTPVTTIDAILARYGGFRPELVKLDVQGFEIEALSGGNKLFGITELFVIETALFPFMVGQPTTREIVSFMADRGYELYDVTEFLRRPYDGALGQVDLAFAKRDGFLRSTNRWA
jgi:FkbM family methyltransferase